MGSSYAFASGAAEAWLFDHERKEGMRKAYGTLYLVSVPLTVIGGGPAILLGYVRESVRIPIAVTGLIVVFLDTLVHFLSKTEHQSLTTLFGVPTPERLQPALDSHFLYLNVGLDHRFLCFKKGFFLQLFAWKTVALVTEIYVLLDTAGTRWTVSPPRPSSSKATPLARLGLGGKPVQPLHKFIEVTDAVCISHQPQ